MQLFDFRVASSRLGHTSVVAISGELDVQTAARVSAKLNETMAGDGCCVVVDLLETRAVDPAGIDVLAAAARRVRSTGGTFVLAVGDPQLLRTLKITGLDRLFEIEPSLREAMEHVVERTPAGV